VPGIIRNNGTDTFHLEVDANGPVALVRWLQEPFYPFLQFVTGSPAPHILRDDGLDGDRVAGDYVFTSEPLRFNTNVAMPQFLYGDTNSPAGLFIGTISGSVEIVETGGQTNEFLIWPAVGILDSRIPLRRTTSLSTNIAIASHLINIWTGAHETQMSLRSRSNLQNLTLPIYQVLPDAFDFLVFFSTEHLEIPPRLTSANFVAGTHNATKIDYDGTGRPRATNTAFFGSGGRLLSLNSLDCYNRGTYTDVATHEITHQWAAYLDPSLGLTDGTGHYDFRSDVGSLVGGWLWQKQGNGDYRKICNYPVEAPLLDKYLMGLIDGASVSPLHVTSNSVSCNEIVSNFNKTVSISQIQGVHGVRSPGPAGAQRNFSVGFIAESHQRPLTPAEITFYDTLAEHYTKTIIPGQPAPTIEGTWASMARYFGEGTTWRSDVLSLIEPKPTSIRQLSGNRFQIAGTGYPGRGYSLQDSTNLSAWTPIISQAAATNGSYIFMLTNGWGSVPRFYRVASP